MTVKSYITTPTKNYTIFKQFIKYSKPMTTKYNLECLGGMFGQILSRYYLRMTKVKVFLDDFTKLLELALRAKTAFQRQNLLKV